jgi:hypothetical protein
MKSANKLLLALYLAAFLLGISCFALGFKMGVERATAQIIQIIMNAPVEGE